MANIAQARKRVRQAKKRRLRNVALRSKVRTYIKKVRLAIAAGDYNVAMQCYKDMVSVVDKMVTKGIFHANKAARYKKRLNSQIKVLFNQAVSE